jgi:Tfp pilus assembly protein PilX
MRGQRGITLMVVLVMLVVLTLFGIAGINLSTSNLNVVGNMQARKSNEAVALQGIETVLSTINYFNTPTAAVVFTPPTGYTATFANRTCLFAAPAAGYSAVQPIVPEDTNWEVAVGVTDNISGATTGITQGVKVRMLAGYCA